MTRNSWASKLNTALLKFRTQMDSQEFDTKWKWLEAQPETSEKELIEAFDRVIHADHPNPGRLGCPGTSVLRQLATAPESFDCQQTLKHIGRCAPCLDELLELRRAVISGHVGARD